MWYVALSNLIIYCTWKNVKASYKNNTFKILAPMKNEEFDLSGGSYSVSDLHDYFNYIIKTNESVRDNPPLWMYVNQIENRVRFRITKGYYLELLKVETMKLLGNTKSDN